MGDLGCFSAVLGLFWVLFRLQGAVVPWSVCLAHRPGKVPLVVSGAKPLVFGNRMGCGWPIWGTVGEGWLSVYKGHSGSFGEGVWKLLMRCCMYI